MSVMLGCTDKFMVTVVDLRSIADPFPSARTGSAHDVLVVSVVIGDVTLSTFFGGGIIDGFLSDFGIGTFNEMRRSVSTSVNRITHIRMATSSFAKSAFLCQKYLYEVRMHDAETKKN